MSYVQPAPVLLLMALVHVSWLEASHLATTLAGHIAWLPLFLIARLGPSLPGRRRPTALCANEHDDGLPVGPAHGPHGGERSPVAG